MRLLRRLRMMLDRVLRFSESRQHHGDRNNPRRRGDKDRAGRRLP